MFEKKAREPNLRLTVKVTGERNGERYTKYIYDVGPQELKNLAKVYILVEICSFGRYEGWAKNTNDHTLILKMMDEDKKKIRKETR